jgi:hypothetical protein
VNFKNQSHLRNLSWLPQIGNGCDDITEILLQDFLFLVLNSTFSNISDISWQPVLVVEEAGVPGENHRPWASN